MSDGTTARFVVRCIRGLEAIVAAECTERGLGIVADTAHREVYITAPADPQILRMRTADDVFVHAAELDDVGHTKAELPRVRDAAVNIDVHTLMEIRRHCGGAPTPKAVDVSASFIGRRNFNRYDIEDAVGTELAHHLGVPYHSRRDGTAPPEGSASWRVTLAGSAGTIALRIADRPLHRRAYKTTSVSGTLHPPLAAAMVQLAELPTGGSFLDPCCGVGTLPIEAYDAFSGGRNGPGESDHDWPHDGAVRAVGAVDVTDAAHVTHATHAAQNERDAQNAVLICGADLDAEALAGARANAGARAIRWLRADAGALPEADGSIDRVAVNPPWGRQVPPTGVLMPEPDRFWAELRRVLAATGRAVVLAHDPEPQLAAAERAGLGVAAAYPVSLFGTHPQVVVLS